MALAPDATTHATSRVAERPLSVVVVEDHPVMREGIERSVAVRGHEVAAAADSADEAYGLILRHPPDVVLTDIRLARGTGIELTRRLLRHDPGLGVVIYSGQSDQALLQEGLDCGARGFALKSGAPAELLGAIERVADGGTYLDPRLGDLLRRRGAGSGIGSLSPREREILQLLARGLTGEEVADALVLSSETVRTHIRNAMTKLSATTRIRAVVLALARGEIDP